MVSFATLNKMTRLIIATDLYPTETTRNKSNETFAVRELVEGLLQEGVDLAVVKFRPGLNRRGFSRPRKVNVNGVAVYEVPKVGGRDYFSSALTRYLLKMLGFDCQADVVVCHMARQYVWAKKTFLNKPKKWIYVIHGSDFKSKYINYSLRDADKVLVRSCALGKQLENRYRRHPDGVVFSGLKSSDYKENRFKGKSREVVRIVVAAKLETLKTIDAVIKSVAAIAGQIPVSLDIYGDGPLMTELVSLRRDLNVERNIRFHGFRSRSTVLEAMDSAHLFVMPSAPETFGLAYLEAMARGCVVIGHKGWGVDGLVIDGINGYLVENPLVEELTKRIVLYFNLSDANSIHRRSFECALANRMEVAVENYAAKIFEK